MKKNKKIIYLFGFLLLCLLCSWFIKSGNISEGVYSSLGYGRSGILNILLMIYYGFYYYSSELFYLICLGGTYGVLSHLSAYKRLVVSISKKIKDKEIIVYGIVSFLMAIFVSLTGNVLASLVFVPFIITIALRRGFDKISAINAGFGGLFIGLIGQTFGSYGNVYLEEAFGVGLSYNIWFKIVMFVLIYCIYNLFAIIHMKKNIQKYSYIKYDMFSIEEDGKVSYKKKKLWPIILIFSLILVFTIMGYINWSDSFGIQAFENGLVNFQNLKIGGVNLLYSLTGNITAFGSWDMLVISFILIVSTIILALVEKVSADDYIGYFANGVSKFSRVFVIYLLLQSILSVSLFYSWPITLLNKLIGSSSFNLFGLFIVICLFTIICIDFEYLGYLFGSLIPYIFGSYIAESFLIIHYGVSLMSLIAPTSLFLMLALSYLDVPYKSWLSYIWKTFGLLLIVILIGLSLMVYV